MLVPYRSSDVAPDMVYTVRFAVNMLMKFFLGDRLERWMPDTVASLVCTEDNERFPRADYYLDMGAAWYFATALAYNHDDILPYLSESGRLRRYRQAHGCAQIHRETFRVSTPKQRRICADA